MSDEPTAIAVRTVVADARPLLHRARTARRKHEAIPADCEKDCWTEETLVAFMAEAHRKTMQPVPAQATPSKEDPLAASTSDILVQIDQHFAQALAT